MSDLSAIAGLLWNEHREHARLPVACQQESARGFRPGRHGGVRTLVGGYFPNGREEAIPLPSATVTVWPAFTLLSLSACPLGQRISMASALSRCPRPNVSTSSLADK